MSKDELVFNLEIVLEEIRENSETLDRLENELIYLHQEAETLQHEIDNYKAPPIELGGYNIIELAKEYKIPQPSMSTQEVQISVSYYKGIPYLIHFSPISVNRRRNPSHIIVEFGSGFERSRMGSVTENVGLDYIPKKAGSLSGFAPKEPIGLKLSGQSSFDKYEVVSTVIFNAIGEPHAVWWRRVRGATVRNTLNKSLFYIQYHKRGFINNPKNRVIKNPYR